MARYRFSNKRRANLFADKHGVCHICQRRIQAGEAWDVSHPIPLAVGGSDDESNWDIAHRKCHRVETSTKDIPTIAKVERQRQKHLGIWRSRFPMRKAKIGGGIERR